MIGLSDRFWDPARWSSRVRWGAWLVIAAISGFTAIATARKPSQAGPDGLSTPQLPLNLIVDPPAPEFDRQMLARLEAKLNAGEHATELDLQSWIWSAAQTASEPEAPAVRLGGVRAVAPGAAGAGTSPFPGGLPGVSVKACGAFAAIVGFVRRLGFDTPGLLQLSGLAVQVSPAAGERPACGPLSVELTVARVTPDGLRALRGSRPIDEIPLDQSQGRVPGSGSWAGTGQHTAGGDAVWGPFRRADSSPDAAPDQAHSPLVLRGTLAGGSMGWAWLGAQASDEEAVMTLGQAHGASGLRLQSVDWASVGLVAAGSRSGPVAEIKLPLQEAPLKGTP